jgi:hypothetical protein
MRRNSPIPFRNMPAMLPQKGLPKLERSSIIRLMATASKIVSIATKQTLPAKNPAAVALGRLGGLKGGNARKAKLSPERLKEIAQQAAKQRWANRESRVVEPKADQAMDSIGPAKLA